MTAPLNLDHWETYYRGGALATCPMGSATGYTLELREVWSEFFGVLPEHARILDVGTGNGAIALLAKEVAGKLRRSYEIHATDLARIDPARDVRDGAELFRGIVFHAHVPTEQLPFPANAFDVVSGQYALEYTVVDAALREIFRVLRSGGRAQFILHHADSVIVRNGRESLEQADLVLTKTKIFRKLRRHIEAERSSSATVRRTWDDLVSAIRCLQSGASHASTSLTLRVSLDAVQKLLDARGRLSKGTLVREIDHMESEIRASARRLRDLVSFAQSSQGMSGVLDMAELAGFVCCELRTQHHASQNLVGWRMNLSKP